MNWENFDELSLALKNGLINQDEYIEALEALIIAEMTQMKGEYETPEPHQA